MDVTKILEADHAGAKKLFADIQRAEGADRQPLIDQLTRELRAHMDLEEAVVYPTMGPVTGTEAVEEANTEHALARNALNDVNDLAPDEPGFGAALASLEAGITHHVEEEEGEAFPALRKNGSVLEKMATPFMTKRLELGMAIDVDALASSTTKDELIAEASSAGVDGARSMSKAELAKALADKMS
ncbi:MAG TPA: hemerythrin domain-containing protein [Acidimicrobiales bacterium]